jgi:hypothetical protein
MPMHIHTAQVQFFYVSEPELEDLRERFATGRYEVSIPWHCPARTSLLCPVR